MPSLLFKKDEFFFLGAWSLLSFSLTKLIELFSYSFDDHFIHLFTIACLQSFLFFLYYILLRIRFKTKLPYVNYVIYCLLFTGCILFFSWLYYHFVMLSNREFSFIYFIPTFFFNALLASALFPITLIKKR